MWVKSRSGICSVLEPELLETIAQRVPRNSEALCGLRLVSAGFAHRSLDHGLFPLREIDARWRQRRCVGSGVPVGRRVAVGRGGVVVGTGQRQVLHVECGASAPEYGSPDHVAQLTDVAGPPRRYHQLTRRLADLS